MTSLSFFVDSLYNAKRLVGRVATVDIIRAAKTGMCFGARGPLQRANSVERPEGAKIHGELVYNSTDT